MESSIKENNHIRITNLLQEREKDRKKEIQKKRDEKEQICAEHEQVTYFRQEFDAKKIEIEAALDFSENVQSNELPNHFDNITKQIILLQKFVSASTLFLKEYEIRRCQEILQNVTLQARNIEDKLLPKKKFGFKKKKLVKKELDRTPAVIQVDTIDSSQRTERYLSDEDFCGVKSKTGEKICMFGDTIFKKDVTLQSLTGCVIKLLGAPSTLHMNCLKDCIILCGPVATSVFAENCESCKFVFACQQLRLHSSKNCDMYLQVTSRAIMEDSSDINFAPYNFKYETLADDFEKSSLDISINNWTSIDDFNWLSSDKKSPNWFILTEELRINDWDKYF